MYRFPKKHRLRKRADFLALGKKGRRVSNAYFIGVFSPAESTRLGVTVTKKIGNAVQRNKLKRTVREYFRTHQQMLNGNWDINIIAKKKAALLAFPEAQSALGDIFQRISPPKKRTPVQCHSDTDCH